MIDRVIAHFEGHVKIEFPGTDKPGFMPIKIEVPLRISHAVSTTTMRDDVILSAALYNMTRQMVREALLYLRMVNPPREEDEKA